jgi:hypothetical protein
MSGIRMIILAAANEDILVYSVAVPNEDIQLTEPLDEWYMELLVKGRVPSPIWLY